MITEPEFEAILADETKLIEGDIHWRAAEDHWPAQTFRVPVLCDGVHVLELVGRWNPKAGKLSYVLLCRGTGRIYALDMGKTHENPDGTSVGETHKHRWTSEFRDHQAYTPSDITETWDRPVAAWTQFLDESRIVHVGTLTEPVWQQELPT